MVRHLDRAVVAIIAASHWLALPLMILLFLQWPLRDLVRAYSREANDLGQIIFAIYVAVSVTAATRAGAHLAADAIARHYSPTMRIRLRRFCILLAVMPWTLFVLATSKDLVLSSILQLERFPDTNNPGYFVLKSTLCIMTVLMLAQAVIDLVSPARADDR
jgi:TRAP-type mannitol/chloroaromatic compound transport system permease small subunit